jgi:hypothetical protein
MLFALSYWDLIFADVEGAFYNPFQMRPADMYEADFLLKREAQYQALQPVLNNDTLFKKRIMDNYQRHFGKACVFTNWSAVDRQLLQKTLERVPLSHIRLCINRILDDPKEHRSGLPDLIVFHGQQDYQLVEVKGPGDRLQNNQKMWMDFFAEHKIPHRLIRVDYESEQSLVVSSETGDLATAAPLQEVQSE